MLPLERGAPDAGLALRLPSQTGGPEQTAQKTGLLRGCKEDPQEGGGETGKGRAGGVGNAGAGWAFHTSPSLGGWGLRAPLQHR